jgi:hypothetical protein
LFRNLATARREAEGEAQSEAKGEHGGDWSSVPCEMCGSSRGSGGVLIRLHVRPEAASKDARAPHCI